MVAGKRQLMVLAMVVSGGCFASDDEVIDGSRADAAITGGQGGSPGGMGVGQTASGAVGPPAVDAGTPPPFPEDGYDERCDPDMDAGTGCSGPYECLPSMQQGGDVCTQPCDTLEDCPVVFSEHCGDQTTCEEGVCGFWYCD